MCVMKTRVLLISLLFIFSTTQIESALGYEVQTHERLTGEAFLRSMLNKGYLLEELKIPADQRFQGSIVRRWLEAGSIHEDDYLSGSFFRFKNHFYDPVYDRGLTHNTVTGERAFEWALEETNTFSLQDFSWRDARQYFLMGLTSPFPAVRDRNMALAFRSLGQIAHLVQDMGSPEHTRNDIHAGVPKLGLGAPSIFEKHIDQIRNGLNYDGYSPPPLARREDFWRTGDGRGFAEFTNHNFISKSTNFTRTENGNSGGSYSSPRLDLDLKEDVDVQSLPLTDPTLMGKVTFFGNVVHDNTTGEDASNSRMTTYSLFDSDLRKKGEAEIFTVNRFTVDAAAPLLIPRAVGYSTALIDYFFRGKLDLDVGTDPSDVSIVRVEGINKSPDKLDGGTLEMYGDDPNGTRTAATPVGPATVFAEPGEPISVAFRLPPNSEKLMAVYKGKLGNELPQGDFVGGVIGKVLSAQRVEQIFTDFTRWYIRSPQGAYPLPLVTADVEDLQWGDNDNTLVGRSKIGPGQPNKFYSYRINRLLGSTHLPIVTIQDPFPDQPAATQMVDLQQMQEFSFPMGVSVGTDVNFSHTLPYKQYVLWANTLITENWVPTPTEEDPAAGYYETGGSEITYGASLLVDETATTGLNYPIILDEKSHLLGSGGSQYLWYIWNIHLTSDNRPLALVHVSFNTNNLGKATFPSRTLGQEGADGASPPPVIDLDPVQVPFQLPELGPVWVLVDVTTGQMLANTAPPTLVMSHISGRTAYSPNPNVSTPTIRFLNRTLYNGGPSAGFFYTFVRETTVPSCTADQLSAMNVVAEQNVTPNHIQTQLTQNRMEIGGIEFGPAPSSPGGVKNFPINCGGDSTAPIGFRITVAPGPTFAPNNIEDFGLGVVRTTPVAGTEQLVFLLAQAQTSSSRSQRTKIVAWKPALARVEVHGEFSDLGLHVLTAASRDAGVVISYGPGSFTDAQTRFVDFTTDAVTIFPKAQLFDYTLLDPQFFYNMYDFKFHLKDPSLQSTGLPADLAVTFLPRDPLGRYHLIAFR
jgi:hypothetical protein